MGASGRRIISYSYINTICSLSGTDAGGAERESVITANAQGNVAREVGAGNGKGLGDRGTHGSAHLKGRGINRNPGIGKGTCGGLDTDNHGLAILEDVGT